MPRIDTVFRCHVRDLREARPLLEYLAGRFTYRSRDDWARFIAEGRVKIDGCQAFESSTLHPGASIEFAVIGYQEPDVPLDFEILKQDGNLAFVHKPPGLPVHRTGRIFSRTLVHLVRERIGEDWSPLNRLDRETGGLVIFARGKETSRRFSPGSPGSRWLKIYLALTQGHWKEEQGLIESALGELPGNAIRCQMHPVPHGKHCRTLYQVLHRSGDRTLVALSPVTGRKHQLRAHAAQLECPIVGDKIYSLGGRYYLEQLERELEEEDIRTLGSSHHLLHCAWVEVRDADGSSSECSDTRIAPGFEPLLTPDRLGKWLQTPAFADFRDAVRQAT